MSAPPDNTNPPALSRISSGVTSCSGSTTQGAPPDRLTQAVYGSAYLALLAVTAIVGLSESVVRIVAFLWRGRGAADQQSHRRKHEY